MNNLAPVALFVYNRPYHLNKLKRLGYVTMKIAVFLPIHVRNNNASILQ